jgi:hypothetical protein
MSSFALGEQIAAETTGLRPPTVPELDSRPDYCEDSVAGDEMNRHRKRFRVRDVGWASVNLFYFDFCPTFLTQIGKSLELRTAL